MVDAATAPTATDNASVVQRGRCHCHHCGWQRGPVGKREAMAEDGLLVLQRY
jgi:hypothetical protein